MNRNVVVTHPEESLYEAFKKMVTNQIGRLPVLDSSRKLVGIIARADVMRAYERKLSELEL